MTATAAQEPRQAGMAETAAATAAVREAAREAVSAAREATREVGSAAAATAAAAAATAAAATEPCLVKMAAAEVGKYMGKTCHSSSSSKQSNQIDMKCKKHSNTCRQSCGYTVAFD